jgi:hypothetical protein
VRLARVSGKRSEDQQRAHAEPTRREVLHLNCERCLNLYPLRLLRSNITAPRSGAWSFKMRRLFQVLFALVLYAELVCGAYAQGMGMSFGPGPGMAHSDGGGGACTEYTTWLAATSGT